jgi:NADH-quinone oxidoreductase subunit L
MVQAQAVPGPHPLAGTIAAWVGLLPLLPLVGFAVNGVLSLGSAFRAGPADPYTDDHRGAPGETGGAAHGPGAGPLGHDDAPTRGHAVGDDSHASVRHRYAGVASVVGPVVVGAAFVLAVAIWRAVLGAGASTGPFIRTYFSWMPVGELQINWAFQVDQLSVMMALVVTGVGFLIHVFSIGYMRDDPGYPRFFAYLNLFVSFMLVLVLGASFPVAFVGWEGVGLCSYLLIGFWFSEKANADAGKKAFIVNRIGDFGFLMAMFLVYANLGTLDFAAVAERAPQLEAGGVVVTTICLFLFLGCAGKSAQLPLHVWLPDAMAGPTPVSALIHAATMVTAGVYLVARASFLFSMSAVASLSVAVVGALTAILAATVGLKQWDIKKVLAYSTISQLGYMFMAVGVGAYVAGIFHLATHAFFKALLFLGSGSVIHAMHGAYHATHSHEDAQDMRNMGGLRTFLPWTFVLMWVATFAICGVPPFSGFFSKDEILGSVYTRAHGSALAAAHWLGVPGSVVLYVIYVIGLAAAFLTAVYMTRMMIYTFHGPNRTGEAERSALREAPWVMTGPLVVLGVLSLVGGWLNLPDVLPLGRPGVLDRWLAPVVGEATLRVAGGGGPMESGREAVLMGMAVAIAVVGIVVAIARLKPDRLVPKAAAPPDEGVAGVVANAYYVDRAYDTAVVTPVVGGSRKLLWRGIDVGLIDGLFVNGSGHVARGIAWLGSQMQTGQVGTYAWAIVVGVLVVLGVFTLG